MTAVWLSPHAMACSAAVALLLLVGAVGDAFAQLAGRVVDEQTGVGVAGAHVRLAGPRAPRTTTTDSAGNYEFDELEAGSYALAVRHLGYGVAHLRVAVRRGSSVHLDIRLRPRPVRMARLIVQPEAASTVGGNTRRDSVAARVSAQRLRLVAGQSAGGVGELVMSETLQRAPPDQPDGRRPHALYIWGSSAERGRVLLDGATLNAPLHLGGILPSLDPALLARADLRTAGTSPRYDGGATYIMDFGTRRAAADRIRSTGALDLLSSTATVELPVGSGGVIAGGRRVNRELIEELAGRSFGYDYADAVARADAEAAGARITVSSIRTGEAIRLPRDQGEDRAAWQNTAVSMSLRPVRAGGPVATASWSRGTATLPLLSAPGGRTRGKVDRFAAALEQRLTSASGTGLLGGVEVEHMRIVRRSSAELDAAEPDGGDPVACTRTLPCSRAAVTRIASYGEASWQPVARTAARAGLRAAYEPATGRLHLLPRAALSVVNHGTRSAALSAGRFSQIVSAEADTGGTLIAHAAQLELTVVQRTERTAVTASAFLRHHEGHGALPAVTAPGADLSLGFGAGAVAVTAGYSVLGRRATDPAAVEFQQLGAIAAGISVGMLRVDASAAYGRGLPRTSIVLERAPAWDPPLETATDDDERSYLRLDASISGEWTLVHRGRSYHVTPYARIVNGLRRRDALFYYSDGSLRGEPQPLGALPALPVVGVRWHF